MNETLKKLAEKYVCHYPSITDEEREAIKKANITFNSSCGVTDICKDGKRVGKAYPKKDAMCFKWF